MTEKTVKKQAVLVVSFGTSYHDSREASIGAIERAIGAAFPEFGIRRAFTSRFIIRKLRERDGLETDNVEEALERALGDGITDLVVQPTHMMAGFEYTDLAEELKAYGEKFESLVLAEPLLSGEEDLDAVVKAVTEITAAYDDGETAVCFMGHGTEAEANQVYQRLQEKLDEAGYGNYFIGTVEAEPSLETVAAALRKKGPYKKVLLRPLMVVAGDHANNDMAGDGEDSWKKVLEKEGYEVTCVLEGLGQVPAVQAVYTAHTAAAMARSGR